MLAVLAWAQTRLVTQELRREEGQGLTEYALILVFVAIVATAVLILLGGKISSVLSRVVGSFT